MEKAEKFVQDVKDDDVRYHRDQVLEFIDNYREAQQSEVQNLHEFLDS